MASEVHDRPYPSLLAPADPPPVTVVNPEGRSPFLFIGDHAGNVIPGNLNQLGLEPVDLVRHIAWDIGVDGLGSGLAGMMDATFIRQTYSRLVVDCNRRPDAVDAVAPISDGISIPGNTGLSDAHRRARLAEVHEPYHQAIAAEIARRQAAGRVVTVIALHSFTPALADARPRPWHVGVLHDRGDATFARTLLQDLRTDDSLVVGDNEPYRMDTIDYTIPRHCYPAGLHYAELEIRQDLIGTHEGQNRWVALLANALNRVNSRSL